MSVDKNALRTDPHGKTVEGSTESTAPVRPGFAPAPRPRKPLQTDVDFAAAYSQKLRSLWDLKRTRPSSLPLASSFDSLELRQWDDNLLVVETQRSFESRPRFTAIKLGRCLFEYFCSDLSRTLLPAQKAPKLPSGHDILPVLQLLEAAYRSKSPRDGQFTGISKDGKLLRTDILVLPISVTGNQADRFLVLIYAEEAQGGAPE